LHDLPINPCVSRMWKDLFFRENKTPLQKLMVAVNRESSSATRKEKLTKTYLVESLDHNIVQIENERKRIERLEEVCMDMVEDARQSNHAKKTDTPDTFIYRLDQMAKDLRIINNAVLNRLSTLQNLRFCFIPMETPKENTPSPVKKQTPNKQAPKKRKRR
jgi:hypothetical protein